VLTTTNFATKRKPIGKGVALRLAQSDVSVTILGRNQARGDEVVAEMKAKGKGEYAFVQCDASLLSNAASFAADYAKSHDKLDYLVMTQGN
jgi:NAD(P)-dependent dehydrogenase (short-subunit alcohol dehydrogenase family)